MQRVQSFLHRPGSVHRMMATVWQVLIWVTLMCGVVTLLMFLGVPAAALAGTLAILFTVWQTGAAIAIIMTLLSFSVFLNHRVGGLRRARQTAVSINKDWQKDINEALAYKQLVKPALKNEEE